MIEFSRQVTLNNLINHKRAQVGPLAMGYDRKELYRIKGVIRRDYERHVPGTPLVMWLIAHHPQLGRVIVRPYQLRIDAYRNALDRLTLVVEPQRNDLPVGASQEHP